MERIAFQKPIASFQLYQAQLAEMATMITNSQLMSLHFGRLKDCLLYTSDAADEV